VRACVCACIRVFARAHMCVCAAWVVIVFPRWRLSWGELSFCSILVTPKPSERCPLHAIKLSNVLLVAQAALCVPFWAPFLSLCTLTRASTPSEEAAVGCSLRPQVRPCCPVFCLLVAHTTACCLARHLDYVRTQPTTPAPC